MPKSRPLRTLATTTNSQVKRNASPGPPSPTFSETTNVSAINFGENGPAKIITRTDLKASMQSYENLLNSCTNYQSALLTMSRATASFADAMESCSGMKGPTYEQGTRLQAAAGLHHLLANHLHVLSETLDKQFEKPLRQHLDTYRSIVHERSSSYERALREKSHVIRETEMRNMNRKERNLQTFREALNVLQRQVEDLDRLKARHYEDILEHEHQVWDVVQGKVCLVVRSTLDVFDRFTAKASDPVIEPMLQSVPDPFDSYGQQPHSEDQIFSILPPLSILVPSSSTPSSLAVTPQTAASQAFAIGTTSGWTRSSSSNGLASYPDVASSSEWDDTVPSASASSSLLTTTRTTNTPAKPPPPRSSSSSPPRRPSSSPPGGSARRAESNLRNVLSVIDEARPRQIDDTAVTVSPHDGPDAAGETTSVGSSPPTPTAATRNGGPTEARNLVVSWLGFPFREYPRSASQDTTPRNSSTSRPASPTADVDASPETQGRQTPEADRTTTLPIFS